MERLRKFYDEIENLEEYLNKEIETKDVLLINRLAFVYEIIASLETKSILWSDLPIDFKNSICFPDEDVGIDLMKLDYSYIGQVKHYKENSYISANDINRFVLCFYHLNYHQFKISNVELITPSNVKFGKPKLHYDFLTHRFINREIIHKWIQKVKNFKPIVEPETFELRMCQKEARNIILKEWGNNIRIKMCCGSGKTDTICSIIRRKKKSRFLILVPLIILMFQWKNTLEEWDINSSVYDEDLNERVVLCVYNSFEKVQNEEWDYIIIDEAHHFENKDDDESNDESEEEYEESNDEKKETYYDLIRTSMKKFKIIELSATLSGEVNYEYNVRQGINDGILCDYQIRVPYFSTYNEDSLVKYLIEKPEFLSILAFCNRIESANAFNAKLIENGFNSAVLTSDTKKKERERIVENFKSGKIKIIVSVNILGEGINLVNADTCLFVEPRSSCYSIVQCVGRVLRISPGKKIAKIIIPTYGSNDELKKFMKAFALSDEVIKNQITKKEKSHRFVIDTLENEIKSEFLYEDILDSNFNYLLSGDWEYKYQLLKEFYEQNERLPKKREEYKNVKLGFWLCKQKTNYKKGNLSEERIDLLDEITEEWRNFREASLGWEKTYELLKEFYEENERLPRSREEYKNVKLGFWLDTQKRNYKKGNLSEDRILLLDEIMEDWRNFREVNVSLGWDKTYELLKEFYEENERLPKVKDEYKNIKLGMWLKTQKWNYKKGKLSEERIDLLDEITEEWRNFKETNVSLGWDKIYQLLKEFYGHNERLPKVKDEYKNVKLGIWLDTQKRNYKKGNLSEDRIALLDEITEDWRNFREASWDETYELLKEFYEQNERSPKVREEYKNIKLGAWLNKQRYNYKKGNLSEDRIALLKQIEGILK